MNPCLSQTEQMQASQYLPNFAKHLQMVEITTDCPKHGKTVRKVVNIIADTARNTCPKCEAERQEAERQARLVAKHREKAKKSGILHYGSFDTWQATTDRMASVLSFVKGYAVNPQGNLIMSGATGTGKTLLANLIASQIISDEKNALLLRSSEIAEQARCAWTKHSLVSESDLISVWTGVDLLIIDEFGEADLAINGEMRQADRERLSRIIDGRYTRGLPTVITTNLAKDQLIERLGDRAWDRLQQNAVFIAFDWGSYRQANSKFLEI